MQNQKAAADPPPPLPQGVEASLSLSQTMLFCSDYIDLSRVPVNKGTNSRLGWTKYSDL